MLRAGPRGRDRRVAARRGARLPVRDGQRRRCTSSTSTVVRAIADELARRAHRGRPRGGLARAARASRTEVVERLSPPMRRADGPRRRARRGVLPPPPRDHARARQGDRAASGLEARQRAAAEWVVLFEDVTPLGSHRLEMHVRSGRALHASAETAARQADADVRARGRPARPGDGAWLLDKPPLMPAQRFTTPRGVGGAHRAGARDLRKGLTMATTHPQKIIDAHCHIGEIPPWKFYDLEHPVKPTVYDYRDDRRSSSRTTWTSSRSSGRWRCPTTACRCTRSRSTSTTS